MSLTYDDDKHLDKGKDKDRHKDKDKMLKIKKKSRSFKDSWKNVNER